MSTTWFQRTVLEMVQAWSRRTRRRQSGVREVYAVQPVFDILFLWRGSLLKRILIGGGLLLLVAGAVVWYAFGRGVPDQNFVNFDYTIPRSQESRLTRPLGVAVYEGQTYVVDGLAKEVQVFDGQGNFRFRFSVPASQADDAYPTGVAIDDDGQVYLSDLQKGHLLKFDDAGQYLSVFPKRKALLEKPLALAYRDGRIYVTDVGSQQVKVFDGEGQLVSKFGGPGKGKGRLSYPNGVAVAADGSVFVSDSNNHRVQVFDAKGRLKYSFGGKILSLPRGIGLDQFGRVYVADTFGLKVMVFSEKGRFMGAFPRGADDQPRERLLQGVSVDPDTRRIYVTDRLNRSVTVWRY